MPLKYGDDLSEHFAAFRSLLFEETIAGQILCIGMDDIIGPLGSVFASQDGMQKRRANR